MFRQLVRFHRDASNLYLRTHTSTVIRSPDEQVLQQQKNQHHQTNHRLRGPLQSARELLRSDHQPLMPWSSRLRILQCLAGICEVDLDHQWCALPRGDTALQKLCDQHFQSQPLVHLVYSRCSQNLLAIR